MNTISRTPIPSEPNDQLILDRYLLLERLGTGGHGTVWLAQDQRLHREVAIKRIPRGGGDDRDERRRAGREALAAARLSHPAIVALYEAGADGDAFYLVSEVVYGATLAERFAAGDLNDRELLRVGVVLADALAHAHSRGVVHRDVKPQNAIVPDEDGGPAAVKLTDFGVARIAGESRLTNTGDVIGTLAYMAPEQAEGREAGAAADLYSLALTLYEGLAGYNPVRGATAAETVRRVGGRVPPLQRAARGVPHALCASIDRALSVDPTRRGSLADLREALATALASGFGEPGATRRRRRLAAPASSAGPIARTERLAGAAGACALVAVALLAHLGPAAPPIPLYAALAAAVAVMVAPRTGFVALGLIGVSWLLVIGEPGAALVTFVTLAPVVVLLRRTPWLWSAPALAPLLGVLSLAGVFPALAARAPSAWSRAALGALGGWWLMGAQLLFRRNLLLGQAHGALSRGLWQASVSGTFKDALGPMLSDFGLVVVAIWALAAVVCPLVVRGQQWGVRVFGAICWATLLAAATGVVAVQGGHGLPDTAMAAAIAAGAIAAIPSRGMPPPLRSMG